MKRFDQKQKDKEKERSIESECAESHVYCDLVLRVGRDRDEEAFFELYECFKTPLFNMAHYMVRDRETALEIVQDVMLAVWKMAPSFKPGPVKGWIFKITSRMCISKNRKRQNAARVLRKLEAMSDAEGDHIVQASAGSEKQENLTALRAEVGRLDLDDRRLLTLYFGMEFSQEEIAAQLRVSQRTISTRLENALRKLRSALHQPAMGAVSTVAFSALLGEALRSGLEVPLQLRELVAIKTGLAGQGNASNVSGGRIFSPILITILVAGVLSLGMIIWKHAETQAGSAGVDVSKEALAAKTNVKKSDAFGYEWDFREHAPSDLTTFAGTWEWEPGLKNADGGIRATGETPVGLTLPIDYPVLNFAVDMEVRVADGTGYIGSLAYSRKGSVLCSRTYSGLPKPFTRITELYIGAKQFCYSDRKDQLFAYKEYKERPRDKIFIAFTGLLVQKLRVRVLTEKEVKLLAVWENGEKGPADYIKKYCPGVAQDSFYIDPEGPTMRGAD